MQFGDLKLRIRWVPTLLLALPIPLFVGLGIWQLDRADQKHERTRLLGERVKLPPFELESRVDDPEGLRFRAIQARGTYDAEGQILIENRRQNSRTGFHVITPLHIAGSEMRVLVNRGWIPAGADAAPPPAPVPDGEVMVTGITHIPAPPALVLHGGSDAAQDWGTRWPYLTVDLYAAAKGFPIQPVVILLDKDAPNGFQRTWPREMPKEGMHIGYAIQWFAFALIALILWLRLSLVRGTREEIEA